MTTIAAARVATATTPHSKWNSVVVVAVSAAVTGLIDIEPAVVAVGIAACTYLLADSPTGLELAVTAVVGAPLLLVTGDKAFSAGLNLLHTYWTELSRNWFDILAVQTYSEPFIALFVGFGGGLAEVARRARRSVPAVVGAAAGFGAGLSLAIGPFQAWAIYHVAIYWPLLAAPVLETVAMAVQTTRSPVAG